MASLQREKEALRRFLGFLQIFVLASSVFPCCSTIMSVSSTRRQATVQSAQPIPGFLAEELLPPPALSASFPTLRPRRPSTGPPPSVPQQSSQPLPGGIQEPNRDLVPPFRNAPGGQRPSQNTATRPVPFQSSQAPSSATPSESFPLLPPIEIPPERPLTDSEILETLPPKETSFIPTTGQGLATIAASLSIPPAAVPVTSIIPIAPSVPSASAAEVPSNTPVGVIPVLAVVPTTNTGNSSAVRFPTDSESASQPPRNCPVCECTNEVDYICASNGVVYLNSCAFDCATFCDAGLKKVELHMCSSKNQS